MNSEKKVAIVIPIYKTELNEKDLLSLRSIENNSGGNEIVIIAPEGLAIHDVTLSKFSYEYFKKTYFKNQDTYSKLLLSCEFYERFYSKYSHILIVQLDALLLKCIDSEFEDYLAYDYVGAPWDIPILGYRVFFKGMTAVKKLLKPRELHVGNGGFSLRNVAACISLLRKYSFESKIWNTGEDVFFSYYGIEDKDFIIPDIEIARSFAIEKQVGDYLKKGVIPYGVHAYEKNPPEVILQLTEILSMTK